MRLDAFLTEKAYYKSRARASAAIRSGCVKVNGTVVLKNAFSVEAEDRVECLPDPVPYVSRGGLKLVGALEHFGISVENLQCVDIGSSTGGFTQVLLERGAAHVTCVDVGHGQLAPELRADGRITVCEGTDARTFRPGVLFDFLCMDVSFISVLHLTDTVCSLLKSGGEAVILIKPQFEVGRAFIGKNGIVKSDTVGYRKTEEICDAFRAAGLTPLGLMPSPIRGGNGNTEYCVRLKAL